MIERKKAPLLLHPKAEEKRGEQQSIQTQKSPPPAPPRGRAEGGLIRTKRPPPPPALSGGVQGSGYSFRLVPMDCFAAAASGDMVTWWL